MVEVVCIIVYNYVYLQQILQRRCLGGLVGIFFVKFINLGWIFRVDLEEEIFVYGIVYNKQMKV